MQAAVNFDSLSGLPNRARFFELVNAELGQLGRPAPAEEVERLLAAPPGVSA